MPEAGRGLKGVPLASAVFNHTLNLRVRKCRRMMKKKKTHLLPHQSILTPPAFHICSVKNITAMDITRPPSSAADRI